MTFDEHEKVQGVPQKKCELLLVIEAVIHTFFGTPCSIEESVFS